MWKISYAILLNDNARILSTFMVMCSWLGKKKRLKDVEQYSASHEIVNHLIKSIMLIVNYLISYWHVNAWYSGLCSFQKLIVLLFNELLLE
jgi:hypothetical protein